MKRPYETMVIFDGAIPDETVKKEVQVLEELLRSNGDFIRTEEWGKRTMAYTIRKKRLGVYCLFVHDSEAGVSAKIDKLYKLNTNVLRHLTVVRELKNIIPAPMPINQDEGDEDGDAPSGSMNREGDD